MEEHIIINDYIENDPLSENNLDKTLDLANKIRLSTTRKSIWLYTGYTWSYIVDYEPLFDNVITAHNSEVLHDYYMRKRKKIISQCNVLIDGRYIDSQQDITLKWRGSKNQRVIDIQKSIHSRKIVLWCN